MRAFRAKPPLDAMLAAMPVKVILNAEAGLARRRGLRRRECESYCIRNSVHLPDTNVSE